MRILILTAATGGGHDMRANALCRWVERLADWETRIHRPLEQGHALYGFGVDTYNWIQRVAPRLHHVYFNFLELAAMHKNPRSILGARRFRMEFESIQPDVVISTHAHLNHGFFELARNARGDGDVRCVTYCGEFGGGYGFSRHWVNPEADLFIGAVDETVDAAIAMGMPEDRARVGGFMLFPGFYDDAIDRSRVAGFIREQLEMDPGRFILLLAVGAAGANNHLDILGELERRGRPIQVVALCGHDERAFAAVTSWGRQASSVRLRAFGYREDMPLILRSVSAVLSRPGTGTTSEAIMSGCPLILNGIGGIMPQESITVRYAECHQIAHTIRSAGEVAEILDAWERNPVELEQMRRNMHARRPRRHPRDILEHAMDCGLESVGQDAVRRRAGQAHR